MKIVFTAGGTGGHFYPIIAVAEAIRDKAREKKILDPALFYMAPSRYNPRALFDNDITYIGVPAGKLRRYFSLLNVTDLFKTLVGVIIAIIRLYKIYPDVVFGKGGYGSFPALLAARILRIPVIIHESDSVPGRVNKWAGKFAKKIAVSYQDAAKFFDQSKVAYTGNPIRKEVKIPLSNGAYEFLNLEPGLPVVLILGGSQGSAIINDAVLGALPELVKSYQIIHQTGKRNYAEVSQTAAIVLKDNPLANRYKTFDYLNDLATRMSAGVASIVVSRAGSTIFEIAAWGIPSIIIPISESISHDQTKNAFAYARSGACTVMEEHNLSSNILTSEINRIVHSPNVTERMKASARNFAKLDGAEKIATVILEIALEHA